MMLVTSQRRIIRLHEEVCVLCHLHISVYNKTMDIAQFSHVHVCLFLVNH